MLAYPGINEVQKKHRVAVLRALHNVNKREPLWWFQDWGPPWRRYVATLRSVRSVGHGTLRVVWWNQRRSLLEIENMLGSAEIAEVMQPGGLWWCDVEIGKGEIQRNTAKDTPELLVELTDLRKYRSFLERDNYLHRLLGRFEPPGSPVFKYAMEHPL